MKKILNVSFSKTGGAGVIAQSLTLAQCELGFESELVYVSDAGVFSNPIKNLKVLNQAIVDKVLVQKKDSSSLFSLFRNDGKISNLLNTNKYIINLHWTPGIVTLEDMSYLKSQKHKYFWTLHDMWPLTGGCHYAFECKNFENECIKCPQAKKIFHKTIAKSKQDKKVRFFNQNLIAITPSNWLAELAKKSKNFRPENIHVINNGIDLKKFSPEKKKAKDNKLLIGLCASDLSDPRKGVQETIEWIEIWNSLQKKPLDIEVILQGQNFSKIKSTKLKLIHSALPYEKIQNFYNSIDVFVSLAAAENFPTTVLEALACGVPSIVNDLGGAKEIVEEGKSGFVVKSRAEFFLVLDDLLDPAKRKEYSLSARNRAENNYGQLQMAKKYTELFANNI